MVFSSPVFLFVFLPLLWVFHLFVQKKYKNIYLLIGSLLFYIYGEGFFVLLMLTTITVTYISVFLIVKYRKNRKLIAFSGIVLNMLSLLIFKYTDFIIEIVNNYLRTDINLTGIHLPLGISFFTFQAVSCIVDVYRDKDYVAPSFSDVALYISFFPQLIAGPIVRYNTFIPQLPERKITLSSFLWGVRRFIYGLAKKILIANTLAKSADKIFLLEKGDLSTYVASFGMFLFTLQIYFDFSGYSDMAIGLARMFGIKIPENFNYPYISRSVTEFWRRWHISLSSWFKDYLYIPLGGNRISPIRTYINLWLVFFLCGLWHGAAWNYVAFGVFHGTIMMIERIHGYYSKKRLPDIAAGIKTVILVAISFTIFRTTSSDHFLYYFESISLFQSDISVLSQFTDSSVIISLIMGSVFIFPIYPLIISKIKSSESKYLRKIFNYGETALIILLFALSITHTSMVSADPFIYFRF